MIVRVEMRDGWTGVYVLVEYAGADTMEAEAAAGAEIYTADRAAGLGCNARRSVKRAANESESRVRQGQGQGTCKDKDKEAREVTERSGTSERSPAATKSGDARRTETSRLLGSAESWARARKLTSFSNLMKNTVS